MSLSFSGGIHPYYGKELSERAAIEPLPPPQSAIVHLSQHIGAPAKTVVAKKDPVKVDTVAPAKVDTKAPAPKVDTKAPAEKEEEEKDE